MKVILMCGSHPRHLHVARTMKEAGLLAGIVIERRENFMPSVPEGLSPIGEKNFVRHFQGRERSEGAFFENEKDIAVDNKLEVTKEELNSTATKEWIQSQDADVVITYGVHKISDDMLEAFPDYSWNIHGGLSPWYRGNTTLFWPFYFLQPNWAGMTIHQLTAKLDAGDIVHHSVPELVRGDGIHDVACRAVQEVAKDVVKILELLKSGGEVTLTPQKSNGKLFIGKDWRPQHLRLVYNTFNNDIVDRYLDGELGHVEPPLVRAF